MRPLCIPRGPQGLPTEQEGARATTTQRPTPGSSSNRSVIALGSGGPTSETDMLVGLAPPEGSEDTRFQAAPQLRLVIGSPRTLQRLRTPGLYIHPPVPAPLLRVSVSICPLLARTPARLGGRTLTTSS